MKNLLIPVSIILALVLAFGYWYNDTYSMYPVQTQEYPGEDARYKLLVATQGSVYKDAVLEKLLAHLEVAPVHVKVVDVDKLATIDAEKYDAFIIMHNWEMWKPNPDAAAFLNAHYDESKMYVLTTSGAGDNKIEGVDAVTSASELIRVEEDAELMFEWLGETLK